MVGQDGAADWRAAADAALASYALDVVASERIEQGLINLTLRITTADGRHYALQRLNPIFGAAVNDNIAAVTQHLARREVLTPRLVPTRDGAWSAVCEDGVWRVMSWIDGVAPDALASTAQAAAAGELLGRFHAALQDFAGELQHERPPVHDFQRHRRALASALAAHPQHRLISAARRLDAALGAAVERLPPLAAGAVSLVHGDPKISNMVFAPDGRALCLIDLDTVQPMARCLELGDALRSWCNRASEDAPGAHFDVTTMAAAMGGYSRAAGELFSAAEQKLVLPATLQIYLELATRFLTDALTETYFGWDAARYPARGEHNLARARAQLGCAESLFQQYHTATEQLAHTRAAR